MHNSEPGGRRKRLLRALLSASASMLVLLAGCAPGKTGQPMDLTILSTGDVGGYVDPCG